jgi:hypothetical protein
MGDDRVIRSSEQLFWLVNPCSSDWTRTSNHPKDRLHIRALPDRSP